MAVSWVKECVILLHLVSIGFAKGNDSFIKNIAFANVSRHHRGIAGAGVSTSQRPAAECSVVQHGGWTEQLDRRFDFHITQLPHIKVAPSLSGLCLGKLFSDCSVIRVLFLMA